MCIIIKQHHVYVYKKQRQNKFYEVGGVPNIDNNDIRSSARISANGSIVERTGNLLFRRGFEMKAFIPADRQSCLVVS